MVSVVLIVCRFAFSTVVIMEQSIMHEDKRQRWRHVSDHIECFIQQHNRKNICSLHSIRAVKKQPFQLNRLFYRFELNPTRCEQICFGRSYIHRIFSFTYEYTQSTLNLSYTEMIDIWIIDFDFSSRTFSSAYYAYPITNKMLKCGL